MEALAAAESGIDAPASGSALRIPAARIAAAPVHFQAAERAILRCLFQ
jgi:hypothetical protein